MEQGFVLEQGGQKRLWLFGLRWQALVEHNALRQARRLVRQMGAQSWVLSGQSVPAVGISQWRHPGEYSMQISAAAYFAALYPTQQHAAIFKLPTQKYWFVAAQNGRVLVRGDYCFDDLEAAQSFMASVLRDYPQMHLLEDSAGYCAWDQFITRMIGQQSTALEQACLRLRTRSYKGAGGVLTIIAAGLILGGYWFSNSFAQDNPPAQSIDPVETALDRVLQWHPRAVLLPALQHLYRLPVNAQGWRLQTAECDFNANQAQWYCQAEYQRMPQTQSSVDVATFLQRHQWQEQAEMLDLERVLIRWAALEPMPEQWTPPTSATTLFEFLSQLQKKQAAFSQINYRQRGTTLPQWGNRSYIKMVGPLRSAPLIYDLVLHVHWFHLGLRLMPSAQPEMQRSRFELYLEGAVDDQHVY